MEEVGRAFDAISLVIDASLTLTWYFEDESTYAAKAVLDAVALPGELKPQRGASLNFDEVQHPAPLTAVQPSSQKQR